MTHAQEMLQLYINAEKAVLKNQAYSIGGRSFTRANLTEIRNARREWERKVADEQARKRGGSADYSVADFR